MFCVNGLFSFQDNKVTIGNRIISRHTPVISCDSSVKMCKLDAFDIILVDIGRKGLVCVDIHYIAITHIFDCTEALVCSTCIQKFSSISNSYNTLNTLLNTAYNFRCAKIDPTQDHCSCSTTIDCNLPKAIQCFDPTCAG